MQLSTHKTAVDIIRTKLKAIQIRFDDTRVWGKYDILLKCGDSKKALPVKVLGGDGSFFKLKRADKDKKHFILAYVWFVFETPRCFLMTYSEALALLGSDPLKTKSWRTHGSYWWSSATGVPKQRRCKMEAMYSERWEWLKQQLR